MSNEGESVRLVRVFVSSPNDVAEERAVLDEVIDRINETDGQRDHFRLELWRWEKDAVPQMGPEPQSVIDAQMPTNYEIYLGILAHRFGSPTGKFGSGTEKEFHDAFERWERTRRPWILLYFKQAMVDPSKLDLGQYKKVLDFQKNVQSKGLYKTYEGLDASKQSFVRQVDLHLRKIIPSVLEAPTPSVSTIDSTEPTIPLSYLDWLKRQCADVDLLGLRVKAGHAVKLNSVYVPLTTPAMQDAESLAMRGRPKQPDEERRPQLLLDRLNKESLYVYGAPGSGKSTFCRWAAWLACSDSMPLPASEEPEGYREEFPESFRNRLPLLVRLRDFWPYLPDDAGDRLSLSGFDQSLSNWFSERGPDNLSWSEVKAHLDLGTGLLIFDGVDEVPRATTGESDAYPRLLLLSGLSEAVARWVDVGNRVLVTSRPYGLSDSEKQTLGLADAAIDDLSQPLQDLLVRRFFHILVDDADRANELASHMLGDIRELVGVDDLATNPMLLTAMCIIYNEGKRLPQDRCDLYYRIVDNVLYNRFRDPKTIELVRNELCVVAHAMHTGKGLGEQRTTPEAQVTSDEIDRSLESYRAQTRFTQVGFEGAVASRERLLSETGLLLPKDHQHAVFYHLSIQEYLAAQRLWDLESDRLADLFYQRSSTAEWHNTLSFLFGTQLNKTSAPDRSIRLAEQMVDKAVEGELGLQVVVGECLQILLGKGVQLGEGPLARFRQVCLDAIATEVSLRERNLLGLALGRISDPRVVVDLRDYDNDQAWVEISAGTYRVGDDDKGSYGTYFRPLDEQEFVVEKPYRMTRFPVTNSQFALFIEEGGYAKRNWWSDEGWEWVQNEGVTAPRFWHSSKWNAPNQPVVGVSYWEAEAFCKWGGGRLPTEREWEVAARGATGFKYPWGDNWEDGICSSREAGLEVSTPVALFPRSRSDAFGLEDVAGNVWEWCQEVHEKYGGRVLRGGSWGDYADGCRCSSRLGDGRPVNRSFDCGFRLARTNH